MSTPINNWITKSASEQAEALLSGTVTSVELTQAHLDRIAEVDGAVHAFLHIDAEGALEAARESDERRKTGALNSLLD
ncbi:MAG: Asp-tRNA(Asn)/Glu-tRNA(Gln) amidotransferase GatCAB subunit A, partial [Myxococcales bacterium]